MIQDFGLMLEIPVMLTHLFRFILTHHFDVKKRTFHPAIFELQDSKLIILFCMNYYILFSINNEILITFEEENK